MKVTDEVGRYEEVRYIKAPPMPTGWRRVWLEIECLWWAWGPSWIPWPRRRMKGPWKHPDQL